MGNRRGPLVAGGLLGAVVLGYVGALMLVAPAGAQSAPAVPAPPAPAAEAVPPQGQMQEAVTLAENHVGGVAASAETRNGAGTYEVEVVRGLEEFEIVVDVETRQVMVVDREVESVWDD